MQPPPATSGAAPSSGPAPSHPLPALLLSSSATQLTSAVPAGHAVVLLLLQPARLHWLPPLVAAAAVPCAPGICGPNLLQLLASASAVLRLASQLAPAAIGCGNAFHELCMDDEIPLHLHFPQAMHEGVEICV